MRKLLARPEIVPLILVIAAFAFGAAQNSNFRDIYYLMDTTSLYAETGLLILGMTFVIISGNIDLSVASTLGLVACVVAKVSAAGVPIGVACVIGVLLGAVLGAINGALVAYGKLPSFLVTLATLALYRGAAQAIMGPDSVKLPASFIGVDKAYFLGTGIPLSFGLFLVLAGVMALVLGKTVFGRWIYAVGSNEEAARYSTVPSAALKFYVFTLAGALAGVAALLIDSRLGVARYDHALGAELDAITAVVVGGAAIEGGKGTILGSVLALLLVMAIRTQMGLNNVTAEYQLTVIGAILVIAVAISRFLPRSRRGE